MQSVRASARGDGTQSFGAAAANVISSPPQAYTGRGVGYNAGYTSNGAAAGGGYSTQYAPPPGAAAAAFGVSAGGQPDLNVYAPMQPDSSFTSASSGYGRGAGQAAQGQGFYPSAVQGAGQGSPQRNPFAGQAGSPTTVQQAQQTVKPERRTSGMDYWPG